MSNKESLRPARSTEDKLSNRTGQKAFEEHPSVESIKPGFVKVITCTWREITPHQAVNIYNTVAPMLSLDSPIGRDEGRDGGPNQLIDSIAQVTYPPPEEIAERRELIDKLEAGCRRLPHDLLEVIRLRFISGLSLEATGKVLGCSRTTVLKLQREALSALREMPEIKALKEFHSSLV